MNRFKWLFFCFIAIPNFLYSTTVNGRIILSAVNDSIAEAKIQINTNTGNDDLGGATIVLNFDSTQLYLPPVLSVDTHYVFQNFNNENYNSAFITRPNSNELWINIELESNNNGTLVSGPNMWTDVVILKMKSIGSQLYGTINFDVNSPYWAIFDGNNYEIWENGSFNVISSVEERMLLPLDFSLNQNYPNPFNPSTTITFSIPEESQVKLVVYNLLGERIREVDRNNIAAGNHEFTFNGDGLPSGTYLYRIETNNKLSAAKKMILLK